MLSHPPRALALLLVALVALAALPGVSPPAQAQERPKVAYVYDTDTLSRDSFVAELGLRGFAVTPLTLAQAGDDSADPDFSQYAIIIIGHDTGDVTGAAGWRGDGLARDRIIRAQRYTVGFGFGGAQFFDLLQLDIGYSAGANGLSRGVEAVNPGDAAWASPNSVPIAADGSVRLYAGEVGGRFARPANLAGVRLLGRTPIADGVAYPIAAELSSPTAPGPCYLLWGHRGAPSFMTAEGRALLENLLRAAPCATQTPPRADVTLTKAAPKTAGVGTNLTYTITVTTGRAPAPGVTITDELPAGATFVSATPSQGSCRAGPRRVVCALGDLASGASATVTIVLRPTEVGTLRNVAYAGGAFEDTNPANNRAAASTEVGFSAVLPPLRALPYRPVFTGPIVVEPLSDLSIHGIEITQGIQCFDTSQGLAGCPDNSLPQVARKSTVARIYLRYSRPGGLNNVPVRLVLIDVNNVEYVVNTSGRALPSIDRSSAANSANVYFSVNFGSVVPVRYYAIVDPNGTIGESNESNNRFPAVGTRSIDFTPSRTMRIISQRLRYHPSGYSGDQYAGGWAVNGGAATWFEQLLPIRTGGITHQVASGYLDWTTTLNSDGQHSLIRTLNTRHIMQNALSWLFGTGAYTGARHVYGWAPDDGYGGGHADMPVYPHAGGRGIVGIGTDEPGTGSDTPGDGALIFGHELVHDYDVKHTDTADSCGSDDDSSAWPYSGSSIQEFGFNPITSKVYDPALTHDVMSYCPAAGSKEGWIAPYTWSYMFNRLRAGSLLADLDQTADVALAVNLTVTNPALGPDQGAFTEVAKINTTTPLVIPAPGDYAVQLRGAGDAVLATQTFSVTFKSEYSAHDGDHPGDPADLASASAHMVIPWAEGTQQIVILHNGAVIGSRAVSAASPAVVITSPAAPATWPAGSTQTISWQAADPDSPALTYSVLYSRDGEEWQLLASGLGGTSYSVAVDDLAGSTEARFRVVASDGVNIGDDETPPIVVPDKAPQAAIANPLENADVQPGDLLVLQGFGSDFEDGLLPDVSLRWRSDRAGDLGAGAALPVSGLAPGKHTITLTATDSAGQSASATAQIFVGNRVQLPQLSR